MKTSFRTVPDTNVIIASQNASAASPNKEFFDRWEQEEFALLYCEDTLREYIRKLLYKVLDKSKNSFLPFF
jgi:predicted nucleic acid-binding protein